DRVGVGRAAGIVAETTVRIAAAERPLRRPGQGLFAVVAAPAQLTQDEGCVETSVPVARWRVDQPTPIDLLLAQHALEDRFRLRGRLSDQPVIVGRVEGR